MHSHANAILVALLLACGSAGAQQQPTEPPAREAVRAAVMRLRDDPNLGSEHTVRSLRWVTDKTAPPAAAPAWIVGLFQFLGQAGSALMWIGGVLAFAIAAVWSHRLIRARSPRAKTVRSVPVAHVGELDIRPASLPGDVGAAALELLEAGRTRDALSLLYRGALSRAVHRFGVTIDASFTEGEALRAVEARLDRARAAYIIDLVALWRHAVYAGQTALPAAVAALCRQFSKVLGGQEP